MKSLTQIRPVGSLLETAYEKQAYKHCLLIVRCWGYRHGQRGLETELTAVCEPVKDKIIEY